MRGNETIGEADAVDVLVCPTYAKASAGRPECGGRLRLLATIARRDVIEKILIHLGLPTQPVQLAPAAIEADLFGGMERYTH